MLLKISNNFPKPFFFNYQSKKTWLFTGCVNTNLLKASNTPVPIKILQLFTYRIQERRTQCTINDTVVIT